RREDVRRVEADVEEARVVARAAARAGGGERGGRDGETGCGAPVRAQRRPQPSLAREHQAEGDDEAGEEDRELETRERREPDEDEEERDAAHARTVDRAN